LTFCSLGQYILLGCSSAVQLHDGVWTPPLTNPTDVIGILLARGAKRRPPFSVRAPIFARINMRVKVLRISVPQLSLPAQKESSFVGAYRRWRTTPLQGCPGHPVELNDLPRPLRRDRRLGNCAAVIKPQAHCVILNRTYGENLCLLRHRQPRNRQRRPLPRRDPMPAHGPSTRSWLLRCAQPPTIARRPHPLKIEYPDTPIYGALPFPRNATSCTGGSEEPRAAPALGRFVSAR
jgi:hypothetical protein